MVNVFSQMHTTSLILHNIRFRHEHLYLAMKDKIIFSNELSQGASEVTERLSGSRIILCTLGMLSSPALDRYRSLGVDPMVRLVVDEASQINVFEYMHLFHKFQELEKVCFFGDPKQLPPFRQDAVPQLQSILNIQHLEPTAYFLNTQYRMPIPLGDFISREVYNSKLLSCHSIGDKSCIAFIDASKGMEVSAGKS
ncbi:hypothetical protein BC629DRAFT_413823 [Irpex lacteus]|nr:hypothetical protein BC629DRAFT_413823 [Irpex lacteus]